MRSKNETGAKPKSQSDKFKEAARDLGVDLDEDKLKEALRKIAKTPEKGKAEDE